MTYLVVLDRSPKSLAEGLADVHLRHTITLCAQLLSTTVRRRAPDEIRTVQESDGVWRVKYRDITLLPDTKNSLWNPWISWLDAEYQRVWWMISLAWFLDKEVQHRFGPLYAPHEDHIRVNKWAQDGIGNLFAKKKLGVQDFPVVLPNISVEMDSIQCYRDYYQSLVDQRHKNRMRWTNREQPVWLKLQTL